jgi:AmmeMemoRadiSam system protein B
MERVRPAAVAGSFYPSGPGQLRDMVEGFLAGAAAGAPGPAPKAVVVPHAGYVYSGPVAASAYARLGLGRDRITRVVLLGPSHRVAFSGLAVSGAMGFASPLGVVPVDAAGEAGLLELGLARAIPAAHAREHSLEVQLPFLQVVLGPFRLVPVVVGEADPEAVARALDRLWGGPETAVVVSSDLSHYLEPAAARALDRATAEAIRDLRPEDLGEPSACGRIPVQGLLAAARRRGLAAEVLDLRNSGDTAGGAGPVVGYGAFAFA